MAKTEIFNWHPLLTRFLAAVGTFPVERGKGDVGAFNAAVELVQTGRVLGMFPEGTRSRTGVLMRGKSGVVRIAMRANAPIVPAVVINSPLIFQQLLKFQRRPQVIVRFGPPLFLTGDPDDPADIRKNTEKVMQAIAALLPPDLRGQYGAKRTPTNEDADRSAEEIPRPSPTVEP
jgi:1-acyl-sn-glycerol-3-phosphate acyltransferase